MIPENILALDEAIWRLRKGIRKSAAVVRFAIFRRLSIEETAEALGHFDANRIPTFGLTPPAWLFPLFGRGS